MKDKYSVPKKLKNLVKDLIRRHAWNMGVSHYMGDIIYMQKDKSRDDDGTTLAECRVDRRYLTASFRIYPAAVKEWKERGDVAMEEVIAHEVAHILTDHLHYLAICCYKDEGETKDAWESLTSSIARISEKLDKELKKKK